MLLEVGANLSGSRARTARRVVTLAADETMLPGLFDLHAHYAIDLFGAGRVDEYTVNPLDLPRQRRHLDLPGRRSRSRRDDGRAAPDRARRAGRRRAFTAPARTSARRGPGWQNARSRRPSRFARKSTSGRRAASAASRPRASSRDAAVRADRPGASLRPAGDRASRFGIAQFSESARRDLHGHRPHRALHGRRCDHRRHAARTRHSRRSTSRGPKSTRSSSSICSATSTTTRRCPRTAIGTIPKDARVFTTWMDEKSFLTPHAREVAKARLPRKPTEQFKRIYEVKFKEVKRFYDAGGGRLITVGTDHPSWGEFLSGIRRASRTAGARRWPAFRPRPPSRWRRSTPRARCA